MKTFNEIEISDIIGLSETKKRDEFHNLVQSIDLLEKTLKKTNHRQNKMTTLWDIRNGIRYSLFNSG